ncbi:hypothetical protein EIN_051560 [Entamoeba invadens IP1]|uniref:hypothetical protein n=1 Tax=Entamoeba invadens IP1 TaxID=370355 RepID=UPI0002C3D13D|nr:hypothetical protein EIN_051560 [Entamoeba invadens IP1]ELP92991.1 hypothetical protein EIN_051560 [Entamoeba invadens IP1]|eukprot:XP_004259762.1 hypothetical protein EIN_051560 [Entamoeba invadens IP1]
MDVQRQGYQKKIKVMDSNAPHTPKHRSYKLSDTRKWSSTNALPSPLRQCLFVSDEDSLQTNRPQRSSSPLTELADNEVAAILSANTEFQFVSQSTPIDRSDSVVPHISPSLTNKTPESNFALNEDEQPQYFQRCSNPGILE